MARRLGLDLSGALVREGQRNIDGVFRIKDADRNASFTANNRVVFNIKGNDYRLVVLARYDKGLLFVKFVGTHAQYDKIDVLTV